MTRKEIQWEAAYRLRQAQPIERDSWWRIGLELVAQLVVVAWCLVGLAALLIAWPL